MSGLRLHDYLDAERRAVEGALGAVVAELDDALPVVAAIRYAVEGGGKRLRPILCVAAYRALRGDPPAPVYQLAAALELIHTYSLVHDDLPSMDDDPVRRGRPSTHLAYGVGIATIAGAAMIPLAAAVASRAGGSLGLREDARGEIVAALCRAAGAGGMVGGQLLDLEAEGRPTDLPSLERIHRMKTGALLGAAPILGGLAAGASELERAALTIYGRSLGLAFQIMDDILDVTGSTAVLGKMAGRDTELEKATFPALAGMAEAGRRARNEVAAARAALEAAGIRSPELDALAAYAVERDR